jgi:hypothetical protein
MEALFALIEVQMREFELPIEIFPGDAEIVHVGRGDPPPLRMICRGA